MGAIARLASNIKALEALLDIDDRKFRPEVELSARGGKFVVWISFEYPFDVLSSKGEGSTLEVAIDRAVRAASRNLSKGYGYHLEGVYDEFLGLAR